MAIYTISRYYKRFVNIHSEIDMYAILQLLLCVVSLLVEKVELCKIIGLSPSKCANKEEYRFKHLILFGLIKK